MRRILLACRCLVLFGLALLGATTAASAASEAAACPLPPPPLPAEEQWADLMAGNAVFVDGSVHYSGLRPLRRGMASWQAPPVSILSCADSRVMPELAFERTVGELFVARVAGNVAGELDLAGLEFAVANGWTNLLVVMGHSDCGAIKAALATTDPTTPALKALVEQIREGLAGLPRTDKPTPEELKAATVKNVRHVVSQLPEESELLRACLASGRLAIVAAYYDAGSGKVERLQ